MIMSMYKVLCVTNRSLAGTDFPEQLQKVAASGVSGIILREKDLSEKAYKELAMQVLKICEEAKVPLILHTYIEAARQLGIRRIHLPLWRFLEMTEEDKSCFDVIGVSTHSAEEAVKAWKAGASYVTAGHVFATDCKPGLEPRGLAFLQNVCASVEIPVYAIGGIAAENAGLCKASGAAGVCLMSSLMRAKDPAAIVDCILRKAELY